MKQREERKASPQLSWDLPHALPRHGPESNWLFHPPLEVRGPDADQLSPLCHLQALSTSHASPLSFPRVPDEVGGINPILPTNLRYREGVSAQVRP